MNTLDQSVPVAVVQVGGVKVSVSQWFMHVFVRMWLGRQSSQPSGQRFINSLLQNS